MRDFFMSCDFDGNGTIEADELKVAMKSPVLLSVLHQIDVPFHGPDELFRFLDQDRSGSITFDEFVTGILKLKNPPVGSYGGRWLLK